MNKLACCTFIVAISLVTLAQPSMALTIMEAPFVTVYPMSPGTTMTPFIAMQPASYADLLVVEANTSTLARSSTGALAIAFPAAHNNGVTQPSFTGFTTSGPAIAQTQSDEIVATRSYFFTDTI